MSLNLDKTLKRPSIETTLDRIVKHLCDMTGTILLTKEELEMEEKIQYAYDHLRQRYQDKDVAAFLIKKFQCSRSSAYNYIYAARFVHGNIQKPNRDYELNELLQMSLIPIRIAIENRDGKELIKAIEARTKIIALINQDNSVDWNKILPNNYFLIINNKEEGKDSLRIDLNNVEKLSSEQVIVIQKQIDDHFDNELVEILESKTNGPSQQSTISE